MIYIGRMESLILMMKKTHNKSFKNTGQKTALLGRRKGAGDYLTLA